MADDLDLAEGFTDVDASDTAVLAAWLDTLSAHPDFRRTKAATIDALRLAPGRTVVEVGCGTGDDLRTMAHLVSPGGRAIGIDSSEAMLARARQRVSPGAMPAVELVLADAAALPLPDGVADAVRIERTLQHVADPAAALAEAARVVRPRGRVALWEPDWGTLLIGGAPAEVGAAVCRRRVAAFRQPYVGRDLPALAAAAGLLVEEVHADVHLTRDPEYGEAQFSFLREARWALRDGELEADAVAAWEADVARRAATGGYLASVTGIRLVATRA